MTTARDKQVLDLWLAVAELPADQRESFLARYCGADTSLIAEVRAFDRQRGSGQAPASPGGPDASASTRPAISSLTPGTVLHERYRIVRIVGGGGMGTVYEAVDLRLRNVVAVKQMIAAGRDADRAFEREASLLASMRHPSIPVVIDYFADERGRFLVMQYIDGDDLSLVLERQGGPCSSDNVLTWASALLNALEYLHSHVPPIVHRDIKPSNVRRTPRGDVVLLDFGLAKGSLAANESSATVEKSVFGYTPSYSPLEQLSGRGTTPRSDLYALGATLYHLATGTKPPNARERASALAAGGPDPLVDPAQLNSRLPPAFAVAVGRAMALDPEDRFASAAAMRAALLGERVQVAVPAKAPIRDRRVDAAIPAHAELARQIDLIAQVRFGESPRLGLEDFPVRRRPAAIEQSSESVRVAYPVDVRSGARLPAHLHLRLIAPDFTIHGEADRHIEVPPDDFSTRVTFMLTPIRLGWCRLNLELYGPEALYLGAIPIESEAVASLTTSAEIRVADLALTVAVEEQRANLTASAEAQGPPASLPIQPLERSFGRSVADERRGEEHDDTQEVLLARAKPVWGGRQLGVALALIVLTGTALWRSQWFAPAPQPAQRDTPRRDVPAPAPAAPPLTSPATPVAPSAAMRIEPPPPFAAATRPPSSIELQARYDIGQLAAEYCASFETLNARMVQHVFASVDIAALQRRFAQYATLRCSIVEPIEFERLDVSRPAGVAQVRFRMRQVAQSRSEGEPRTEDSDVRMVVRRANDTQPWVIDRVQNRATSTR